MRDNNMVKVEMRGAPGTYICEGDGVIARLQPVESILWPHWLVTP
jgi:hypothetical protein